MNLRDRETLTEMIRYLEMAAEDERLTKQYEASRAEGQRLMEAYQEAKKERSRLSEVANQAGRAVEAARGMPELASRQGQHLRAVRAQLAHRVVVERAATALNDHLEVINEVLFEAVAVRDRLNALDEQGVLDRLLTFMSRDDVRREFGLAPLPN